MGCVQTTAVCVLYVCPQRLAKSFENLGDIGYLQVKILKATDLLAADLNGTEYILHIINILFLDISLLKSVLCAFFSRKERSVLRSAAGERPAADPHHLQDPES
jgi:hypothetical protein